MTNEVRLKFLKQCDTVIEYYGIEKLFEHYEFYCTQYENTGQRINLEFCNMIREKLKERGYSQ